MNHQNADARRERSRQLAACRAVGVLALALTWLQIGGGVWASVSQDPAVTRRLTRVPAPVGPGGRVQDLYTGSYALLVGINRYDAPAAWPSLGSVPEELAQLKSALVSLGFDRVEQVLNATGAELRQRVGDFIGQYGYEPGARLVFFFSGHGHTLDNGRRGYFVPRDAPDPLQNEARFRAVALSMDQVATWARDITARHAMFAFDSCFSGTIFRTRDRSVPEAISELTSKKVRIFMSAGDAGEPVPARSVFTPLFIRALRGAADMNKDGFVTGTELGNWVQGQVLIYGTRQNPQFGKLRELDYDEGDVVFAVPGATPGPIDNTGSSGAGISTPSGGVGDPMTGELGRLRLRNTSQTRDDARSALQSCNPVEIHAVIQRINNLPLEAVDAQLSQLRDDLSIRRTRLMHQRCGGLGHTP
jgi:caspase domain-containing protein